MTVSIRNRTGGRDPVARTHRRAAAIRTVLILSGIFLCIGGIVWLMFASSVFAVTDVVVEAGSQPIRDAIERAVDEVLGQRRLGFLRPARNILLLSGDAISATLLTSFENVESFEVTKEYPHTVRISVTERTPRGIWCISEVCQYFDTSGVRWGSALKSRGPLLLLVRDERTDPQFDARLFEGMSAAVDRFPEIGLRPISVTFPESAPGDMRVSVAQGYEVIVDVFGDVPDQLATLGVLVAEKATDAAFRPQYIDVRTPGRVYYR